MTIDTSLALLGVLIGVVSLAVAYLSHPEFRTRIRENALFRSLNRMLFLGQPKARFNRRILLADCFEDIELRDLYKRFFLPEDLEYEELFTDFRQEKNIKEGYAIDFSDQALSELNGKNISQKAFMALLLLELGRHQIFLHRDLDFEPLYFPMRNGMVAIVSRNKNIIAIKNIEKNDVEPAVQDLWQLAIVHYLACRNLDYRRSKVDSTKLFLKKRNFINITRRFNLLYSSVSRYAHSESLKRKPSHDESLFNLFDQSWTKLQRQFDDWEFLTDKDFDNILEHNSGNIISLLESLLSIAHKILSINSIIEQSSDLAVYANERLAKKYAVRGSIGTETLVRGSF